MALLQRNNFDAFESHDNLGVVTIQSPMAIQGISYNHFPDNPTTRVGGCYDIDDFDENDVETFAIDRNTP